LLLRDVTLDTPLPTNGRRLHPFDQVLNKILEHGRIELVHNGLAAPFAQHKSSMPKDRQMT
jgi:hypothetical protein